LYAVTTDHQGGTVQLHVLTVTTATLTHLDLTAPRKSARATQLTIHGTLHGAGNAIVQVHKHDIDGSHTLPPVHPASNGSFTITDTPRAGGPNTYIFSYSGDTGHAAAANSVTVDVSRLPTALRLEAGRHIYSWESNIHVIAHLGATYRSRKVRIMVKRYGQRFDSWFATVDANGDYRTHLPAVNRTTFRVVFEGDERYAPARRQISVKVRAGVTTTLRGGYRNSKGYRLFHPGAKGHFAAEVVATNAKRVYFQRQEWDGAHWRTRSDRSASLEQSDPVEIGFTGRAGHRYRLRAVYHATRANAGTRSRWRYVKYV
jgi:hypothetical protein